MCNIRPEQFKISVTPDQRCIVNCDPNIFFNQRGWTDINAYCYHQFVQRPVEAINYLDEALVNRTMYLISKGDAFVRDPDAVLFK